MDFCLGVLMNVQGHDQMLSFFTDLLPMYYALCVCIDAVFRSVFCMCSVLICISLCAVVHDIGSFFILKNNC